MTDASQAAEHAAVGAPARRARSDEADRWLTGLLAEALAEPRAGVPSRDLPSETTSAGTAPGTGIALVAVGGYGRRQLAPGSDLDVLLLHDGSHTAERVGAVAEAVWYPIWNTNTRLDHSVRTVPEARETADSDLRALLGMLDARLIAGDARLVALLRETLLRDWRAAAARRLDDLRASCEERAARHGELAYLLEGDLKEARGGLRDVNALRAITASWLADVPHGEPERARDVLLDVRDALHQVTGRAVDRLLLQEQDAVARLLRSTGPEYADVTDADALLHRVAEAARGVSYTADIAWRRLRAALTRRHRAGDNRHPPNAVRRPLAEGVVEHDGEVVLARGADPAHDPVLTLRAAAAAARAGLPLAPHALHRLVTESAPLPEPWPAAAREEFTAMLAAGAGLPQVWEALDRTGVLARLLPVWRRVRSLPQRNALHTFTVDRHQVEAAVRAAALTRRVARPDLLVTAALLHDIGKGGARDHSEAGAEIVTELAPRLGFPAADTAVLVSLVHHHLTLADLATHRDPGDPATLAALTAATGDTDTLDLLHALTEADALATGPAAWGSWRARLVADLVRRATASFAGVRPPPGSDEADLADAMARCRATPGHLLVTVEPAPDGARVTTALPDRQGGLALIAGVLALHRVRVRTAAVASGDGYAAAVWTVSPDRGSTPEPERLRTALRAALEGTLDLDSRLIARDAADRPRRGLPAPAPTAVAVPRASNDATVIDVRARDTAGLLYRIAGALTGYDAGGRGVGGGIVEVRTARVATLAGEAVDTFYVVDARTGRPLAEADARALARHVQQVLGG